MNKYNRNEIIIKLIKMGLKPVYHKKSKKLLYFTKHRNKVVGIKILGYLDFLGAKVK